MCMMETRSKSISLSPRLLEMKVVALMLNKLNVKSNERFHQINLRKLEHYLIILKSNVAGGAAKHRKIWL